MTVFSRNLPCLASNVIAVTYCTIFIFIFPFYSFVYYFVCGWQLYVLYPPVLFSPLCLILNFNVQKNFIISYPFRSYFICYSNKFFFINTFIKWMMSLHLGWSYFCLLCMPSICFLFSCCRLFLWYLFICSYTFISISVIGILCYFIIILLKVQYVLSLLLILSQLFSLLALPGGYYPYGCSLAVLDPIRPLSALYIHRLICLLSVGNPYSFLTVVSFLPYTQSSFL